MKLFSSWIMTSKPGPEQCTKAASITDSCCSWGRELQQCFHAKAKKNQPGGQNMALQKRSPGFPGSEELRIHSQAPGAEEDPHGITTAHSFHPQHDPSPDSESGARAAASPGKHHPAFVASLVCSALRTDPMGAVAPDWESTGSHSHGLGLLRPSRTIPLMGRLPNKSALIQAQQYSVSKQKHGEEVKSFVIFSLDVHPALYFCPRGMESPKGTERDIPSSLAKLSCPLLPGQLYQQAPDINTKASKP